MTNFSIKLGNVPIGVQAFYESTRNFCREYLTEEKPEIQIQMRKEDIEETRRRSAETDVREGRPAYDYSDQYLETIALYRRILDQLLQYGILLCHGSVIAVNGKAYLFTAESGVGKTTHTRLWLKNIPDCHVLNGDKPLLLFEEDAIKVCGTPWQGKENYGRNEILSLEAICFLERGGINEIEMITFRDVFASFLSQIHFPAGNESMVASLKLLSRLGEIRLYRLRCNMEDEAAMVAYRGMIGNQR